MAKKNIEIDMNSDMNKIVNMISVDLPSSQELFDFSTREKVTITDMSLLTGATNDSTSLPADYLYLLRDLYSDDDYKSISYVGTTYHSVSRKLPDSSGTPYRSSRKVGIRPVLRFNENPYLFDLLTTQFCNSDNKISLGMIPQEAVNEGKQNELNEAFDNGLVKETMNPCVFDGVNPFSIFGLYYKSFKPLVYNCYEYGGKQYIRWEIKHLRANVIKRSNRTIRVKDVLYKMGDHIWIEVTPAQYTIDKKNKVLLADKILLSGIQFVCAGDREDGLTCSLNYEESNMKNYLDTYMKPNLLRNVSKMVRDVIIEAKYYKSKIDEFSKIIEKEPPEIKQMEGGFIPYSEIYYDNYIKDELKLDPDYVWNRLKVLEYPEEVIEALSEDVNAPKKDPDDMLSERSREVKAIRNEIRKYARYSLTETNALEEADQLIQKFNEDVMESDKLESTLHLGVSNPDTLFLNLKLDLTEILNKLKEASQKVAAYFDMVDILTECKKDVINKEYDDICESVKSAKILIDKFLLNPETKRELLEELNNLLDKHIKKCEDIIMAFRNNEEIISQSLEELKLAYRKDERDYLSKLTKAVQEQKVVNEIFDIVNSTIDNQNKENRNLRIAYFISKIDGISEKIRREGDFKDREELELIRKSLIVDKKQSLHTIIRNYADMLKRAMALELKIEERMQRKEMLSKMIIDIGDEEIETAKGNVR